MRAGTMRDIVSLLASVSTADPRFGQTEGFQQYAVVPANVTPQSGTEAVINQGVQSEVTHLVTMRYRPDVKNTDRIMYRNNALEVLSVIDPDGRRREMVIQAKQYSGVQ